MCGASLPVSRWARVAFFWLAFCFGLGQVPLTAQSTTPGPAQAETKPLSVMDFDSALKQARNEVWNSLQTFEQARSEAESWRLESLKWQTEALRLSFDLTKARKDSEGLSKSLTDSLKREADLKAASDKQDEIDAQALEDARTARDEARSWNLWAWIGGAILGALTGLVIGLIL